MPTAAASRRTFLQTGTAAIAGGSLLSSAVAAAGPLSTSVINPSAAPSLAFAERPVLRKALKYSMIGGNGSLAEKFKLAKDAGFEGVDLDSPADHDEVNAAQKSTGLIVHGVVCYDHWQNPLSAPDAAARETGLNTLRKALRDSKAYGGTTVLLVPAVVKKDVSYQDAYNRSQAEIRKVLPLAKELGIKILFENVWNNFLLSPVEACQYIDQFESDMVGMYFDVGNIVRYGWPEHWIRALGARIGKLDIKEYSRKIENEKGPYAGFSAEINEGDCDWPAVMAALKEIGFSGWASAEVRGGEGPRLKEISQRMDKAFETF